MKYTIKEFAQQIRDTFPGEYDDLSNSKLVELWLKKYPSDIEKVNLDNSKGSPSWVGWFVFIMICLGAYYVIDINFLNKNQSDYEFQNKNQNFSMERAPDSNVRDYPIPVDSNVTINNQNYPIENQNSNWDSEDNQPSREEPTTQSEDKIDNWINIIGGGIDMINELSKSREFEKRTIVLTCTKCGETIEVWGYYKESTDEFKPLEKLPTKWFHTHRWTRLK